MAYIQLDEIHKRLSSSKKLMTVDDAQSFNLVDVPEIKNGIFEVDDKIKRQWDFKGKIDFWESWKRADKTEMILFNPEAGVKMYKTKTAFDRYFKDDYVSENDPQKEKDEDRIIDYFMKIEEERYRGFTTGGKIGSAMTHLPAFVGEFIVSGGLISLGKAASKKGIKLALQKGLKKSISESVEQTMKSSVTGLVGQATVRSTLQPHRVIETFSELELQDRFAPTEKGLKILASSDSERKPYINFMKAVGDVVIENFSELTGAKLSGAASYIIPKKLSTGLSQLWKKIHPSESINNLFTAAGFNGFLEELGEERVGDFLRAVFNVDNFGEKDGNIIDRVIASIPDGEQLLVEAGVIAPFSAGRFASNTIDRIRNRRESDKEYLKRLNEEERIKKSIILRDQVIELEEEKLNNIINSNKQDIDILNDLSNLKDQKPPEEGVDIPKISTQEKTSVSKVKEEISRDKPDKSPQEVINGRIDKITTDYNASHNEAVRLIKEKNESTDQEKQKQIQNKINNILKFQQELDKEYDSLIKDRNNEVASKVASRKKIEINAAKVENLIFDSKVKALRRGFKAGQIDVKNEIKSIRSFASKLLTKSTLNSSQKLSLLKKISSIDSIQKLENVLPDLKTKIDSLAVENFNKSVRVATRKIIQKSKPLTQGSKPVGKISADYQDIFNYVRKGIKGTKEELELKFSNLSERLSNGENLEAKDLMLYKALSVETLNVSNNEAIENFREISDFYEKGKSDIIEKQEKRKKFVEDIVDQAEYIISQGQPIKSKSKAEQIDTKEFRDKERSRIGRIIDSVKKISNIKLMSFSWTNIIDSLSSYDKTSGTNESFLSKISDTSLEISTNERKFLTYQTLFQKAAEKAYNLKGKQLLEKFDRDSIKQDIKMVFDAKGHQFPLRMSRAEARKRYMELQDPTLRKTFFDSMDYTADIEIAIEEFLSQDPRDFIFIKEQFKIYKKIYNDVNAIYKKIYNHNLPFNEFYSPIKRAFSNIDLNSSTDSLLQEVNHRSSITKSALKNRANTQNEIKIQSDLSALGSHSINMAHFVAWAEKIRDLNAIYRNDKIKKAVEAFYGDVWHDTILKNIDNMARGSVASDQLFSSFEGLRQNFVKAAIMLKPAIAVKQLTSFVAYADSIPILDWSKNLSLFLSNPKKFSEKTKDLFESPYLKNRWQNALKEIQILGNSEQGQRFIKNKRFLDSLMIMTKLGDTGAIILGGWPVYKYYLDKTGSKEKALLMFERITDSTQQSSNFQNISSLAQKGQLGALVTQFMNSPNQYFNKEYMAIRNLLKGRGSKKQALKTIAIYHFVLPMFFQFVADGLDFDEENQAKAAILGSFNGLFLVGEGIHSLITAAIGGDSFPNRSFYADVPHEMMRLSKILDDFDGTWEDIYMAGRSISDIQAPFTGLGIKQVLDMGDGVREAVEGDFFKGMLQTLGWSPYILDKRFKDSKKGKTFGDYSKSKRSRRNNKD